MAGGARGRSGSLARHLGLAARELELEAGVGQDPGRCGAAVVELLPLAALRVRLVDGERPATGRSVTKGASFSFREAVFRFLQA